MIKNGAWVLLLALDGMPRCEPEDEVPDLRGFQGTLELEERSLSFEVTGRLTSVRVTEGQAVEAGDEVARVDSTLERINLERATAELNTAEAELALLAAGSRVEDIRATRAELAGAKADEKNAKRIWERSQSLAVRGVASPAELDNAQTDFERATARRRDLDSRLARLRHGARQEELDAAQARVEAARASVRLTRERIDRHVLRAAVPGTVLEVHLEPSELAMAGAPVVTVADTNRPRVDVFVPEARVGEVAVGAPAQVRVDAAPQAFAGTVEFISTQTEFTPRYLFSPRERPNLVVRVRVRIDDPNAELRAGVPAFVLVEGVPLS